MALAHATRTDEAYVYIRQTIIDGTIPFGSRLHIGNLAQETGFSTTPIREALAKLQMYGLAESFPHRGVFVSNPCEREVYEMWDGRLALELYMARFVIENVTEDDIPAMKRACKEALAAQPDVDLVFEQGMHGYYAHVAQNNFLELLYQRVMTVLNVLYIRGLGSCQDQVLLSEYRQKHYAEEIQIVDAIADRDRPRLEEAVANHVEKSRKFMIASLKKWPPKGLTWEA